VINQEGFFDAYYFLLSICIISFNSIALLCKHSN
jgi:hypothetical protein